MKCKVYINLQLKHVTTDLGLMVCMFGIGSSTHFVDDIYISEMYVLKVNTTSWGSVIRELNYKTR